MHSLGVPIFPLIYSGVAYNEEEEEEEEEVEEFGWSTWRAVHMHFFFKAYSYSFLFFSFFVVLLSFLPSSSGSISSEASCRQVETLMESICLIECSNGAVEPAEM